MPEETLERYEVGLKILSRNDAYLSSVNTKSTVLLSFAAAVIAAIGLNYNKFKSQILCPELNMLFGFFIVASVLLLLISIAYSLYSVYPNVTASRNRNNLSFVDVVANYDSPDKYSEAFSGETDSDMMKEISFLNYNLSLALVSKYNLQRKSINFMVLALFSLVVSIILIIIG